MLSNHKVYRSINKIDHYIYYLKHLDNSNLDPLRTREISQCVALEETLATRLMYRIFGPLIIPIVYPIEELRLQKVGYLFQKK